MPISPIPAPTHALDQVRITKQYRTDKWYVLAEVLPTQGGVLPAAIFIYENMGTGTLGPYQGVCSLEETVRLQVWMGTPIPKFGNRFVRHTIAEIPVDTTSNVDVVLTHMKKSLATLRTSMLLAENTTTIASIG